MAVGMGALCPQLWQASPKPLPPSCPPCDFPLRPRTRLARASAHEVRSATRHAAVTCRAQSSQQQEDVPDVSYDFVARNQNFFRVLPLWSGAIGVVGLLANRLLSGIAPVVDAGSSQSRTDVLGIGMSAVLVLTGLQWLSLRPKEQLPAPMEGEQVVWLDPETSMPQAAADELRWAWQAFQRCTRSQAISVFYKGRHVFHGGYVRPGVKLGSVQTGDTCETALRTGKGNYLANLTLYPGRKEFMEFLPEGTQGVVVQPIGNAGVLVAATDTVRGFGRMDQAWISTIADKLDVSLESARVPQPGTGFGVRR